jgi:hypothetical protein
MCISVVIIYLLDIGKVLIIIPIFRVEPLLAEAGGFQTAGLNKTYEEFS